MDGVLWAILEMVPALYRAWQRGRVSRWGLSLSLVASVALPVLALSVSVPVVRSLLWGSTAIAWMALPAMVAVGCRDDEKNPGALPPRGQCDHSASDD